MTIGDDCFIGHGVMFVNDTFSSGGPAGRDRSKWGTTTVGNDVSIGSNATILPVKIADGVVIGAGAVVTRDMPVPGIYAGNPARLLQDPLRKDRPCASHSSTCTPSTLPARTSSTPRSAR